MGSSITPMYINPMVDVGFKYLFGTEKHKNLLKGLLENVFKREIEDIDYGNSEQIGESLDSRNAYFDVFCKAKNGPDFIVECQVKPQEHFAARAVYYSARSIVNQAPKGQWGYDFNPVYFLGIIDFMLPESVCRSEGCCIQSFMLRNDETGGTMTDKIKFVFMEVGPFNKSIEECKSFEDKFLFYMKNLPTFAKKPIDQEDIYFEELLQTAEYLKMDQETQAMYEKRLKEMRDIKNVEDYARKMAIAEGLAEGLAEGREKGLAEGREEGREEGRAEGRAEGRDQERERLAINLLKLNVSVDIISQATGLSDEALKSLKEKTD